MVPSWLRILSILFIVSALLTTLLVILDLRARPQPMWIMNLVWPLTTLYMGPIGLWMYHGIGRAPTDGGHHHHDDPPLWQSALKGATHCGAGCAVGDLIGEWLVFFAALTVLGSTLLAKYAAGFLFAYVIGIFFQYFSIAPMRGLGLGEGIVAAVKADTLSLLAYEIGMFGWMAVSGVILLPGLEPTSWTYWFMMQVAMMLGLLTTMPVNAWLIRRGVKEAM